MTQEERLREAKFTEIENLKSLRKCNSLYLLLRRWKLTTIIIALHEKYFMSTREKHFPVFTSFFLMNFRWKIGSLYFGILAQWSSWGGSIQHFLYTKNWIWIASVHLTDDFFLENETKKYLRWHE